MTSFNNVKTAETVI